MLRSRPGLRATAGTEVHESTKEKVRYAVLMSGLQQAELVERAVDEYVDRHREEFGRRMERAREALPGGKASTLAYATDVSEEDVARVGGVASPMTFQIWARLVLAAETLGLTGEISFEPGRMTDPIRTFDVD